MAYSEQHVGDLRGRFIAVIGAGKMGALISKRLKAAGCTEIAVLHRTDMSYLVEVLAKADIAITSTGAQTFVLTASQRARCDGLAVTDARCLSSTSQCRATAIRKSRRSPA